MDFRLIRRLVGEKLRDRSTYVVALVVGTLINLYGQLLVPWLRGLGNPFDLLAVEFSDRLGLAILSIFLAYAFPVCVGIYSSVATRYKTRRFESVADFPDRKPDPVFRVARDGKIVELGAATRELFEIYDVVMAQQILGEKIWSEIIVMDGPGNSGMVFFAAEGASYIVSHAPTNDDQINVYLTRLPA
ncbi:MAG: hypothetical protein O3B21_12275 [Proteobacteria bacterium]|nr:hypothetical protein [Pseudomonadota bacterium]MDA1357284.1 hypothetical protein [Pseudomonadota bacterium]